MNIEDKRKRGQFYTTRNPFKHNAFYEWAKEANLLKECILEPFAGSNSLIDHLKSMRLCRHFKSFDIKPAHIDVKQRDTLKNFPTGYDVCITNPPWLAKNSATSRGLPFPKTKYDDLYKFSLEKCLNNCAYVAALVPESFIRTSLFSDRLYSFVSIINPVFSDTNHPVGLALFLPQKTNDIVVYSGDIRIGTLDEIRENMPKKKNIIDISFNEPNGNLGLIALDNTKKDSIRFCDVSELKDYKVKKHGRHITKLQVSCENIRIKDYNAIIKDFRDKTHDVLMTSYRGLRSDGRYRRRLDWQLARAVIENV